MAEKARGLGLRVIAHTRSGDDHGTGCPMVPLETLLRESDFLSLHAPLTPATRHILDERALRLMRPHAVVLNTSRGPLIDPTALVGGAAREPDRRGGARRL